MTQRRLVRLRALMALVLAPQPQRALRLVGLRLVGLRLVAPRLVAPRLLALRLLALRLRALLALK